MLTFAEPPIYSIGSSRGLFGIAAPGHDLPLAVPSKFFSLDSAG
jgi:hypothetical protein